MKKYIITPILIGMLFCGCSGDSVEADAPNENGQTESLTTAQDEANAETEDDKLFESEHCDEIMTDYEEFMDAYLKLLVEITKNPTSTEAAERYSEIMNEKVYWDQNILPKIMECAQHKRYADRMLIINEKYEKAMGEITQ